MPQLNGGGGDDLGANDEMISFKDEGEQEEKISENSSAERDLADVKSSLVNESETNQNSSSDSEVSSRLKKPQTGIDCPRRCLKKSGPYICYFLTLIDFFFFKKKKERKLTIALIVLTLTQSLCFIAFQGGKTASA